MKTTFLILALALPVLAVPAAHAAGQRPVGEGSAVQNSAQTGPSSTIEEFTSRVLTLNQIVPSQNPQYKLGSRALNQRLLDQNRRALGDVTDIILGENGRLGAIEAEVIATGFDQTLQFDVVAYNVTAESDAFSVTMTRDQVEDNLPDLMAAVETASGSGAAPPATVKSLIGARVQTSTGSQVAVVDDVLIQEQQKMASALLLTLMKGGSRATVAVPYADTRITRRGSKATVEVTGEQARILASYAKRR